MKPTLPVSLVLLSALCLSGLNAGCGSSGGRQIKIYAAGEKAAVDKLTYSVIDTQIQSHLGDDPAAPRIPQNRFYLIQVAVSSGGSADLSIPAMTLVDDAGKVYNELADGTGVSHWLGVVRKVAPAQTERGFVVFDAPAAHYKLRLTSEIDPDDIYVDLPLNFVHERMTAEGADPDTGAPAAPPAKK